MRDRFRKEAPAALSRRTGRNVRGSVSAGEGQVWAKPVAGGREKCLHSPHMKAWRYLKAAVLHRWRLPVLGEVPVNLAALGIFGVMGLDQPVFWAVGGGFQALWLTLTAGRTAYRRKVDEADRREIWRRVEEGRLALVGRLSPDARHRHHLLRATCQELSDSGRRDNRPEAAVELYTWLHLKLLLARETLSDSSVPPGASGTPVSGRAGRLPDDPALAGLMARALLDVADPAARSAAEHAVSLLESRRHQGRETGEWLTRIDAQIVLIETEIAVALGKHRLDHTPHDFHHSLSLAGDRLRDASPFSSGALGASRGMGESETP